MKSNDPFNLFTERKARNDSMFTDRRKNSKKVSPLEERRKGHFGENSEWYLCVQTLGSSKGKN